MWNPCPHTMAKAEKESRLNATCGCCLELTPMTQTIQQKNNPSSQNTSLAGVGGKWNYVLPATGASAAAAGAAPAAAATTAPPDGTDANFLEPATSQRRWFYFQRCVTIKTINLSCSTVWQQTGALTNWHYSPCATVHMLLNWRGRFCLNPSISFLNSIIQPPPPPPSFHQLLWKY